MTKGKFRKRTTTNWTDKAKNLDSLIFTKEISGLWAQKLNYLDEIAKKYKVKHEAQLPTSLPLEHW